jgi:hypothetical protein
MERLSNRQHAGKTEAVTQYVYLEKEPEIQYVDREVIKEVPVETVVVQYKETQVDLSDLRDYAVKQQALNDELKKVINTHADTLHQLMNWCNAAKEEFEMQRRALIGLKAQRDVDRKRRLTLIRRMKTEQDKAQKRELKLKLAIGASLLLSIVSLIVKL